MHETTPGEDPLSLLRLRRDVALCDQFEAEHRAGRSPHIEDFLARLSEDERPALLRELLDLEKALACRRNEASSRHDRSPDANSDQRGSPGFTSLVDNHSVPETKVLADTCRHPRGDDGLSIFGSDCRAGTTQRGVGRPPTTPEVATAERYELLGEIARGGMGAVLRARDRDLGRELAVKVLHEGRCHDASLLRRFLAEARITGQLQHPGIPPVHGLGTLPDGRPFFAMKLIKGRTLSDLLGERPGPATDLPRFLAIFEQVAQTVAYAHSRGVIHRDLKPLNVMVGAFGEVQVMDWGLAKTLEPGDGRADTPPGQPDTVVDTGRDDSDASHAGSVFGTPAYMPPEQARGEVDRVDARADVFALGSMLCDVLTGRPAYHGQSPGEVHRQAELGDLAEARGRLACCGADAELVALAGRCLAPKPEDRPGDAGAVAAGVSAYLGGVRERLRSAELARVEDLARAEEAAKRAQVERRGRRLAMGLAMAITSSIALGVGAWSILEVRRTRIERRAEVAFAEAKGALERARGLKTELAAWSSARTAAEGLLALVDATHVHSELADRCRRLRNEARREAASVVAEAEAEGRDRRLVAAVIAARSNKIESGARGTATAIAAAFRTYGVDVPPRDDGVAAGPAPGPVAQAFRNYGIEAPPGDDVARTVEMLSGRPRATREVMGNGLREWAIESFYSNAEPRAWRGSLALADLIDPDPAREAVMRAWAGGDGDGLRRLAAPESIDRLDPSAIELLANSLLGSDSGLAAGAAVLRRGLLRHPRDPWLNEKLGQFLVQTGPKGRPEAIGYLRYARTFLPHLGHQLAHLLAERGLDDEAEGIFRDLTSQPAPPEQSSRDLGCLAQFLKDRGRPGAEEAYRRAVAALREAVRLRPDDAEAHRLLGEALKGTGDHRH